MRLLSAYMNDLYETIHEIHQHVEQAQTRAQEIKQLCESAQAALTPYLSPGDARLGAMRHLNAQAAAYLTQRESLTKYTEERLAFVERGKSELSAKLPFDRDFGEEQLEKMRKRMTDARLSLKALQD